MITAMAPTAQPTAPRSIRSIATMSQEPMPGSMYWVLPTVKASEATTKNQPPDMDIMVFQIRAGVAKGSSSLMNFCQGERPNCWVTSARSPGSVRRDW